MMILGFFVSWLTSFVVYISMISSFSAFGDSPEFITAAATLGIPHAPGYPLYTMIAHAFTKFPWGTIAWRVNLVSAVFASFTVGLTYMIIAYLVRQTFSKLKQYFVVCISFAGSMILAFSSIFWLNALVAEVFALNNFFAALLIYLILVWREKRLAGNKGAKKWFYLFAFVSGLSMTHHYTIGFFLFGFVYLIYITDKDYLTDLRTIAAAFAFFALGLLPMLYLPWAASRSPALNWGDAKTMNDLWRVIARLDYKRPLSAAGAALGQTGLIKQIPYFLSVMTHHIGWMLVLVIPAVFLLFLRYKQNRKLAIFLFLLYLASGPVFVIFATGYPTEIAVRAAIIERFFLLSEVPLTILLSLGLAWLITMSPQVVGVGLILLVFLGTCIKAQTDYPFVNQKNVDIFEHHEWAIMTQLPPKTLFISYGDDSSFGIDLQQIVHEMRPDIAHVRNSMLSAPWYRRQIQSRIPNLKLPEDDVFLSFGVHWARNELVLANLDVFPSVVIPLIFSPEAKRDFRLLPVYDSYLAESYQKPFDLKEYEALTDRQLDQLEPIIRYFKSRELLYKRIASYPHLAWEHNIKNRLANSLLQEGIFLLENNQPQSSLKFLLQSYELEPGFYPAFNLGVAYVQTKDFTQAETYFMQALKFKPDDQQTILELEHLKVSSDSASP